MTTRTLVEGVLLLSRDVIVIFYSVSQLNHQDSCWGSLTPQQRCSWYILQRQPTWPTGHLLRESYSSAGMQYVYSTASANLTTRTIVEGVYSSAEMQLVYSTAPANLSTRTLVEGVLLLSRDAVGIFYSLCQLDHQDACWGSLTPQQRWSWYILQPQHTWPPGHLLRESYSSAEMQLVHSTAPANLTTRTLVEGALLLSRDAVGIFYSPSQLDKQDTCWGSLTPQQRCSWYILQPQPTWPPGHFLRESYFSAEMQLVYSTASANLTTRTLVEGVLFLSRDAVGIFYSLSQLTHQDTCWGSLTPQQRCSWYILQPQQTWPPGHLLRESYSSAEMQLVYSTAPANLTTRTLVEEVLLLSRDAVGIFYSLSQLDHQDTCRGSLTPQQRRSWYILQPQPTWPPGHLLRESYSSAEMQLVYSTASASLTTRTLVEGVLLLSRDAVGIFFSPSQLDHEDTCWGSLTPQQKCSLYILQPQPTWPPGHLLRESYSSAEMQLVYSTASANLTNKTLVEGVLLLSRDVVGIFYSPSQLDHQETCWGSLTPQQRCNCYILQPKPTWPPGHLLKESYSSAEM